MYLWNTVVGTSLVPTKNCAGARMWGAVVAQNSSWYIMATLLAP